MKSTLHIIKAERQVKISSLSLSPSGVYDIPYFPIAKESFATRLESWWESDNVFQMAHTLFLKNWCYIYLQMILYGTQNSYVQQQKPCNWWGYKWSEWANFAHAPLFGPSTLRLQPEISQPSWLAYYFLCPTHKHEIRSVKGGRLLLNHMDQSINLAINSKC